MATDVHIVGLRGMDPAQATTTVEHTLAGLVRVRERFGIATQWALRG